MNSKPVLCAFVAGGFLFACHLAAVQLYQMYKKHGHLLDYVD